MVICRPHISPSRLHKGPFRPRVSPFTPHIGHLQGLNLSLQAPILVVHRPHIGPYGPILVIFRPSTVPYRLNIGHLQANISPYKVHIGFKRSFGSYIPHWSPKFHYSPILVIYRPLISSCRSVLVIYKLMSVLTDPILVPISPYWPF